MSKLWKFLKDNWPKLLAALGGAVAAVLFIDRDKKPDPAVQQAEEAARIARERAEAEEQARIEAARIAAELQKKIDDENARQARIDAENQIDKQVATAVASDLENTDGIAGNFADAFGGTNVKNDEK